MINNLKYSILSTKRNIIIAYVLTILFITVNTYFIYNENLYFLALPAIFLIAYLAFFHLDKLVLTVIFFVPVSYPLDELTNKVDFGMHLPTEPILFGILILYIFKLLTEKQLDIRLIKHPISISIFIYLGWMLITSITSSLPVISFKFFLSRLWFIVAFYFISNQIFANYKNIKRSFWLYIIPFMGVIIFTIVRHVQYGIFDKQVAHWVMYPFYNDHTIYSAVISMYIPIIIGLTFMSNYSRNLKFIISPLILFFFFAEILSYSRAGWVSIVGALGVMLLVIIRMDIKFLLTSGIILIVLFLSFQKDIFQSLEKNTQDSSADIEEHIQSISNISSDASNLERINRWQSAFRMHREKPFLGWGPGTYQFKYAPFQLSSEKTIISTDFGTRGTAHSEYIGPLAESGYLGTITFAGVIITTIIMSIRLFYRVKERELKMLVMCTFLGLVTYYIHGFLNNFLDSDKAAAPFWSFMAIIVAIDLYHSKTSEQT